MAAPTHDSSTNNKNKKLLKLFIFMINLESLYISYFFQVINEDNWHCTGVSWRVDVRLSEGLSE